MDNPPYPSTKMCFLPISRIGISPTKTPIKFIDEVINAPKPGEIGNCPFELSYKAIKIYIMYTLTPFIPVRLSKAFTTIPVHEALLYFAPKSTSQRPISISFDVLLFR